VDNVLQVGGWDLGRRDVEREDFKGKVFKGEVFPVRRPVVGKSGDFLWDKEAAIRGKTLEDDFFKRELSCISIQCVLLT
jgi:hypothetical protein